MPKKLDPDYEPPTDEQIWEAIETAKKTFREHDQRLREKLSQIVPGFDSANDDDWIRLTYRLMKQNSPEWNTWREMPITELLVVVDEMVRDRDRDRDRDRYQDWQKFDSYGEVSKFLGSKGMTTGTSTVGDWLKKEKPWIAKHDGYVLLNLDDPKFCMLKK